MLIGLYDDRDIDIENALPRRMSIRFDDIGRKEISIESETERKENDLKKKILLWSIYINKSKDRKSMKQTH